jgi:O-acetylserine/cysteine efflux transporter
MAYAATLFGFASWARLLHRYPTALVSPFALLIPVSGIASGALFLGETLAPLQAVGAALVLVGLVVNVYGTRLRGAQRVDPVSGSASAPIRERL